MATFVLVHGAWGGGWEWRDVARGLTARGHEAFTPTLTGLGERSHLLTPDVGLDTHIRDVINVLEFDDLHDVFLCGHSSASMVITAVAEEASERLAHLVYVDSPLPEDGKSLHDLLPAEAVERFREIARTDGDGWRLPVPDGFFTESLGMPVDVMERYAARVVDSPLRMFEDKIRISGDAKTPRTYIRCTDHDLARVFERFAERARSEGWGYYEIASGHDPQILAPEALAEVLDRIAAIS